MLSVQCEVLSLVCGSLCVCIYVCVCVSNPVPKGLFHDPTFPCRGMERTCEAPSNEAPHMILGYRQGRLPTYLQSTVAHAVHSFGLFHQPTPASATQPSNQPSPQPIAAQWDPPPSGLAAVFCLPTSCTTWPCPPGQSISSCGTLSTYSITFASHCSANCSTVTCLYSTLCT